jgi:hypothetical protein
MTYPKKKSKIRERAIWYVLSNYLFYIFLLKTNPQICGKMGFGDKLTSVDEWENLKFEGEMRFGEVGEALFGLTIDANEWGWIGLGVVYFRSWCLWVRMKWLELGGEGGVTLEFGGKRKMDRKKKKKKRLWFMMDGIWESERVGLVV